MSGSYGKESIAYYVSATSTCNGKTCVYGWTPTMVSSNNQITIYDVANDPNGSIVGRSGYFNISSSTVNYAKLSNASTSLGTAIIGSGGAVIYPVTFTFTLSAGNGPIFLSKTVTDTGRLDRNASIVFDAKGFLVPTKGSLVDKGTGVGDSPSYYYIAPGQSRVFAYISTLDSRDCPQPYSCYNIVSQVNSINYGINANNLSAYSIIYGLENLKVSVNFNGTSRPSITVLSPNGGEVLYDKTSYPIKWTSNNVPSNALLNVWLLDEPSRLGSMVLARVQNTGSANWIVTPLTTMTSDKTSRLVDPSGKYVIWIECADHNCTVDDSNYYFTIAPSAKSNPPVITGGTFPTNLSVNQNGTWTVNAYDPKNSSLSYSVDWGEVSCPPGYACSSTASSIKSFTQTSSFTHSYSSAGTYTVRFTVKNSSGLSAETSTTVRVGNLQSSATIDMSSLTSYSSRPTLSGYAYNAMRPFGITISNSGGKVWGSGNIAVNNNRWSVNVNQDLSPGVYQVNVYSNNVDITIETLRINYTAPVIQCPIGYICTPLNSSYTCPVGYVCTPITYNCPVGYKCYTPASSVIQVETPYPTEYPTPDPSPQAYLNSSTNLNASIWNAIKDYFDRN